MTTAFYALAARGHEAARVAAIARHIPDAVAYLFEDPVAENVYAYHNIRTEVVTCDVPGCPGVTPDEIVEFVHNRDPERLVMDAWPYGMMQHELRGYIAARRGPTFFLQRQMPFDIQFEHSAFTKVMSVDGSDPKAVATPNLTPFSREEILSRMDARVGLELPDGLCVVVAVDEPDIFGFRRRITDMCSECGIAAVVTFDDYPITPWLLAADLVVGNAGQVIREAQMFGVPTIVVGGGMLLNPSIRSALQTLTPSDIGIAPLLPDTGLEAARLIGGS